MSYILVIDDDPVARGIVGTLLEDAGHEIAEASDGLEGLRKLAGRPADLVIVGASMNAVDRIEFLQEICWTRLEAPVLMMSGGGRGATVSLDCGESPGAVSSIVTPFDEERLLTDVARILTTEGQTGASPRRTEPLDPPRSAPE